MERRAAAMLLLAACTLLLALALALAFIRAPKSKARVYGGASLVGREVRSNG